MQSRKINGAAVRDFRQLVGLSLRDLARDINLNCSNLSRLERGEQQCSPAMMRAIATRLKVSIDSITYMESAPELQVVAP